MLLEVIMEADVTCPFCARLKPIVQRLCDDLDIPFIVKYLGNRAVAAHEDSVVASTFSPEWVEKWGLDEHKEKLDKIAPVMEYLSRIGAQTVPNLIIRWHDGARVKEIVIRGFNPNRAQDFVMNLYTLLKMLKKVVWGR